MRTQVAVLFLLLSLGGLSAAAQEPSEIARQRFQQGLAYERLGRFEEAYTELQLAANLDPNSSQVALALGLVASRLERYDEAQRALERSIALDAGSVASYYQLALLYEQKGLPDRALDSWHRFIQLSHDPALKAEAQKHIRFLEGRR